MPIKRLITVLALLLAIASLTANASVKVNNLYLVKNGQFTELTIACDSKCEYTHQIVDEPGKPYRIVVDIKDAVHALPQHAYGNLPTGMVKQIRTSQYSSEPDNVVRVVVDATGNLTYKVKSDDKGVTLFINAPADKDFPQWSAVPGGAAPALVKQDPPKNDAPKGMPAAPGNEQNAPKVDRTDPAKQDLKLASKPIDEGKLLNKNKPATPQTQATTPPATASQPAKTETAVVTKPAEQNPQVVKSNPNPAPTKSEAVAAPVVKKNETPTPTTETPKLVQTPTSEKTEVANVETQPAPAGTVNKNEAPVQQPVVASKPTTVDPKLLESIYGKEQPAPVIADNSAAKPTEPAKTETKSNVVSAPPAKTETVAPVAENKKTEPAKIVDSSVSPSTQTPATPPSNMVQPPKAQKTTLPEVKVNPKPKFAGDDSVNALDSKLATIINNNAPTATAQTETAAQPNATAQPGAEETLAQENGEQKVKSKSEIIREKYQATREALEADRQKALDSASLAQHDQSSTDLSKIDRIRLKYKRGIKFSDGSEEAQEYAYEEPEYEEDESLPTPQVGPYNEFLPEREIVVYNSGGRVDPFEPMVEDAQKSTDYDRIPDVESLRLVGILQDKKSSRALFEDANGYSYILQTGDRVKNGFVLSISADRVVFQIRQYGWNRQVALDLEESH